ncbi:MAG: hypothetical protein AAF740_00215 [Bacteroidota bacterium]
MDNQQEKDMDQPLDGKYLGQITSDFVKVAHLLRQASYEIRKRNISQSPIFVMTREPAAIGQLLIEPRQFENDWFYSASFMEEFEQRGLIHGEGKQIFAEHYKNPDEFACVFVVTEDFTKFTYIPFPEETDEKEIV